MSRIFGVVFLLLLSACGEISLGAGDGEEEENDGVVDNADTHIGSDFQLPSGVVDAYDYINYLRNLSGMLSLNNETQLENAAAGHTDYLIANNVLSHDQTAGLPGFTGEKPWDRAVAAGYKTVSVAEGIANGTTAFRAMDNLMSAIYHRFTLLDLRNDRIGIDFQMIDEQQGLLVHNMSNNAVNEACKTPFNGQPAYTNLCASDISVSVSAVNTAWTNVSDVNPVLVVWPPENGVDIPPVFYEETPDPLPDYSVSGYPVSVQFNFDKVSSVVVNDFKLYDRVAKAYVSSVRQIDADTDPARDDNQQSIFKPTEFALFPLQRLEWGREYQAELEYVQDGVLSNKTWTFKTREFADPIVRVAVNDTDVDIDNGKPTYVYFVPVNGQDVISQFSSAYPPDMDLTISFEDRNTLRIDAAGNPGDNIRITLNNARTIDVTLN